MILLALGCSIAMLRPAHSLGKLEGSGNLGVVLDPTFQVDLHSPPSSIPIDLEYRLGLGAGLDVGVRGLLPPRALSVKYAVLDERRHATPVSVAVAVEAGAQLSFDGSSVGFVPFLRSDLLCSGTARPSPGFQIRPAASAGWWTEPDSGKQGFGWTAGIFLPMRLPGGAAIAPGVGASGRVPLGGEPDVAARLSLTLEPWLEPATTAGGPP